MLKGSVRCISALVVASLLALSSSSAEAACPAYDHVAAANDIIAAAESPGHGAVFFTASVKDAYSFDENVIDMLWDSQSPSSALYYQHILNANHFTQVTSAGGIASGDILVINATTTYSGHTVMITGAVTEILPQINPIVTNTRQWAVPIVDSTSTSHGCNAAYPDSRWSGTCASGTFTAGPGTAWMRIYTNATSGALEGYTWSVTSSTTSYYSPSTRPYAIGRLDPCPPAGGS